MPRVLQTEIPGIILDKQKLLDVLSWQIIWIIEVVLFLTLAMLAGGILALFPAGLVFAVNFFFDIFENSLKGVALTYLVAVIFFTLVVFIPTLLYRLKND